MYFGSDYSWPLLIGITLQIAEVVVMPWQGTWESTCCMIWAKQVSALVTLPTNSGPDDFCCLGTIIAERMLMIYSSLRHNARQRSLSCSSVDSFHIGGITSVIYPACHELLYHCTCTCWSSLLCRKCSLYLTGRFLRISAFSLGCFLMPKIQ